MTDSDDRRERILRAAFDCREDLIAYARSLLGKYSAAEDGAWAFTHSGGASGLVLTEVELLPPASSH